MYIPPQKEKEVAILNIDDKLHKAIVKQFLHMIMLDIVSFTLIAIVLICVTIRYGIHIIALIVLAVSIGVALWNYISLARIIAKKYTCYLVTIDKMWEEKGTIYCRFTPDMYDNYDLTGAINIKNYTKDLDNVKVGEQVIVVVGKLSRYVYLFHYNDYLVAQRKTITVTTNHTFVPSQEYQDKYNGEETCIESSYFGKLIFSTYEENGTTIYTLAEGLERVTFGSCYISDVIEFAITEENLEETVASLEQVFRNSEQIYMDLQYMILGELNKANLFDVDVAVMDVNYVKDHFDIEALIIQALGKNCNNEITFYGKLYDDNNDEIFIGKTIKIAIGCDSGNAVFTMENC